VPRRREVAVVKVEQLRVGVSEGVHRRAGVQELARAGAGLAREQHDVPRRRPALEDRVEPGDAERKTRHVPYGNAAPLSVVARSRSPLASLPPRHPRPAVGRLDDRDRPVNARLVEGALARARGRSRVRGVRDSVYGRPHDDCPAPNTAAASDSDATTSPTGGR